MLTRTSPRFMLLTVVFLAAANVNVNRYIDIKEDR
jgi:hypothetical protein